jgi:hypothetical protein
MERTDGYYAFALLIFLFKISGMLLNGTKGVIGHYPANYSSNINVTIEGFLLKQRLKTR